MTASHRIGAAATALLRALHSAGALPIEGLMGGLGLDRRQVNNAFRRLAIRGYAVKDGLDVIALTMAGSDAAARGEVITGGPKGQVKLVRDSFRLRAWRAMRVRKSFTIGDIVSDATDANEIQPRDNAARYIRRLVQAGYVRELPGRLHRGHRAGSNGYKRFILLKNTGPKAPVWRSGAMALHDPNTGEDVPCATS